MPSYICTTCDVGHACDRIYSAWWDQMMTHDANARVAASMERHLAVIG